MTAAVFEVGEYFELALMSVAIYAFELILIGHLYPGSVRSEVFTRDFMMSNFEQEHRDATSQSCGHTQGYPDNGYGRYSDRLPYQDWLKFAKAQRVHNNFLEAWGPQTVFIIIGALGYPLPAAVIGATAIFGRLIYSYGYMKSGGYNNPWRKIGAFIIDVALLAGFVLSMMVCVQAYRSHSNSSSSSPITPSASPATPTETPEPPEEPESPDDESGE